MHERKRIDLRVTPEQRREIEAAAWAQGKTITQFILEAVREKLAADAVKPKAP